MNLIDFYKGESSDVEGRKLDEILSWPDDEWEFNHDFIQWAFPTREREHVQPRFALLSDDDIRLWHSDPLLKANLRRSFDRFLAFLGLTYRDGSIVLVDRKPYAWFGMNHNWLRISRVLNSLNTLGLHTEADELFACLSGLRNDPRIGI